MQVLGLSREEEFLRQVATVFSDGIATLHCGAEPQEFLETAASKSWDVFFVDFDALPSGFTNPVEFIRLLGPNSRVLLVGSSEFANWLQELETIGVLVLRKPNTIGEIGLALRTLAAGQPRGASS